MIKRLFFLGLYSATALASWGTLSSIDNQEKASTEEPQSMSFLKTSSISPASNQAPTKAIYRWKDHQGNWNYSDQSYKDMEFEDYQQELYFLRALERSHYRSSKDAKQNLSDDSYFSQIPGLRQIGQLFQQTKHVEDLISSRQENIDKTIKQSQ